MKKILTVLFILSGLTAVWSIPQAQAGLSASKSYKLSVTIPESIQQQPLAAPILFPSESQIAPPKAASQGFQLVETLRNNQKIVLITYVVE
jgi:hypothetical protein